MDIVKIVDKNGIYQNRLQGFFPGNIKKDLCDVIFIVKQKRILACSYLVSCFSPVLITLITSKFQETNVRPVEIEIPICDEPDAFEKLIEYCMTGYCECDVKTLAVPLLFLSEQFQVKEIKEQLSEKLMDMITPDNAFDLYIVSRKLKVQKMIDKCLSIFEKDPFGTVINREDIELLPKKALEDLLLMVNFFPKEVKDRHILIFKSIVRWVRSIHPNVSSELDIKQVATPLILRYIDFKRVSAVDFQNVVMPEQILDPTVLLKLALYSQDQKNVDISDVVPKISASLSTFGV